MPHLQYFFILKSGKHLNERGFTLVELVVVVIILGILAATALPKFLNLGQDAHIAAVNGLASAVKSAANIAAAKCQVTSTCKPLNYGPSQGVNSDPTNLVVIDGVTVYFSKGYPIAWFNDQGIDAVVSYEGLQDNLTSVALEFVTLR